MRILVVQESDWLGKGPHQSHHLMERLAQQGHIIKVIDFEILWKKQKNESLFSKRQVFEKVHKAIEDGFVTVVRPAIIRLPFLDYLSLASTHRKEIREQIRDFKPNVVVCFGILNARIALTIASRNDIPTVYYIIDELHRLVPQRLLRGLARFMERSNMRDADLVLSINEALRDYTIQCGAPISKTLVIRAGVNLEDFSTDYDRLRKVTRHKYGFLDGDVVLLFMGWLYEFSGLKEVAIQLCKLDRDESRLKLLIVGEGELQEVLGRMRDALGLRDRLILDKWIPYKDVPALVMSSDICILPAYKNDIMRNIVPIKLYEYMAGGKPVISTNLPGILREFGTANGVIFVEKPEDVLTKASELVGTGRLREEGDRARRFATDNSWDTVTKAFETALLNLQKVRFHSDQQ